MLKKTFAMIATTLALLLPAFAASAATVNFSIDSVVVGFTQPSDTSLNAQSQAAALPASLTATATPQDQNFVFFLKGKGNETAPESFSISAAITVTGSLIGTVTYNFLGTISGWTNNGANVNSGSVTWAESPTGSPLLSLLLLPISPMSGNSIGVTLRYAALEPAVVPLPAGVLLLGTALLGLFGLSRRRKLAAA